MNFRGRGGFRPPFRGPGPGPRFMGGGGLPPRPLFFDGPPNFHPRNHADFFTGPNGDFYDNGPPPPYFDGPPGPDFDEFPPYFEPEMRPDVVMRDPYGGDDFPPPPPLRRGPPPRSGWKREDRILRNPHPHTSPPKLGPPKVNKVQPLVDIVVNTPPLGTISTPSVPQSAVISSSVEVKTSPSVVAILPTPSQIMPSNLTPPSPKLTTPIPEPTISATTATPAKKEDAPPTPAKAKESKPHPVVSGVVTQILDSSGVVDGKIFFDASTMVGPMPSVGDAVVVEVECVTGLPFELIGRRVQIMSTIEQVLKSRDEMNPRPKNDAALEEEYSKFLKESNLASTKSSGSDDCDTDNVPTPATTTTTTPKIEKSPEEEAELKRLRTFRAYLAKRHKMLQRNLENADRLKRGLPPVPKPKKHKGRKHAERAKLFNLRRKLQKNPMFTGCPIPILLGHK